MSWLPRAVAECLPLAQAPTQAWLQAVESQPSGLLTGIPAAVRQAESAEFWLKFTRAFARPQQSGFSVGALAIDPAGNGYPGANFEWPERGLQHALHAEQSALLNAWMAGARGITELWVTALPCGHCRQLLMEIPHAEKLLIKVWGDSQQSFTLSELLPHPFRLSPPHPPTWGKGMPNQPAASTTEELSAWLEKLRTNVRGAYTGAQQAVLLTHPDAQQTVLGLAFESAAYNPSISAESAAYSRWQWTPNRKLPPTRI